MDTMTNHEAFAEDVAREFKFLEDEYAMRRDPVQVTSGGVWIAYSGPSARVIVEHEQSGHVGVTVQNPRHVKRDPLERGEFDLEEIVATSPGQRQGRRQDPRSITEAVTRAAQTLRAVGGPVLKGDFEALHARQRKAVEALRRHNPLTNEVEPPK